MTIAVPTMTGGCATSFAPEEASTSLTSGPQVDPEIEEQQLRIQQLFIRGITRSLIGDNEQAIFLFEQAIQIDENQPAVLHALAEEHATTSEFETALYYSRRAHQLDASNRAYMLHYVEILEQNGYSDDALISCEQWLTVYPRDSEVRFHAGELLVDMGREQEALSHYREIIKHDGDDLDVRFRILQLYNGMGNTDGMLRTVEAMLAIDPTNNALLLILADIYLERGQTADAIEVLERAVDNDSGDIDALMALSQLYREMGRDADAGKLEASATKDLSGGSTGRMAVATELYSRAGTDKDAAERAAAILSDILEDQDSSEALFMLGNLYYRDTLYTDAAEMLTRALALDPRHPDEWARAASSLHLSGDALQALSVASEGLMLFPGQFPLLSIAAEVSFELGDYPASIEYSTEALDVIDREESTTQLRAHLQERIGDAHAASGNLEMARSFWKQALESDPGLDSARSKLESQP